MNKYIFILGNHPEISIGEIKNLFKFLGINTTYRSLTREILIVNTEESLDVKYIMRLLGGTIKITEFLYEDDYISLEKILNVFGNDIKIRIGISSYDKSIDRNHITNYLKKLKKIANNSGKKINFILPKENNSLSSAQVFHKILPKGYEINIFRSGKKYIFSKTLLVQDVNTLSKLDYGVPYTQTKAGMLPPKLAQMMINLSLPDHGISPIFYDPFCGTGRVIIQALFMGFTNIYGSDINQEAITKSKKNVDWLTDRFGVDIDSSWTDKHIFTHDTQDPDYPIDKKINSLVCEPDLGKAHKLMPSSDEINNEFEGLEKLYLNSFKALQNIIINNTRVVVVFPKIGNNSLYEKLVDKLELFGYHMERNFIYKRDYQIVERHICVFRFTSN